MGDTPTIIPAYTGVPGPMNSCPRCGAKIKPEMMFCSSCGMKLQSEEQETVEEEQERPAFCSECGAPLEPDMKFCTVCGHKVDE